MERRKKKVGKKSLTHSNKRSVGTDLLQLCRVTQPSCSDIALMRKRALLLLLMTQKFLLWRLWNRTSDCKLTSSATNQPVPSLLTSHAYQQVNFWKPDLVLAQGPRSSSEQGRPGRDGITSWSMWFCPDFVHKPHEVSWWLSFTPGRRSLMPFCWANGYPKASDTFCRFSVPTRYWSWKMYKTNCIKIFQASFVISKKWKSISLYADAKSSSLYADIDLHLMSDISNSKQQHMRATWRRLREMLNRSSFCWAGDLSTVLSHKKRTEKVLTDT